jgi:hypothetical protein
MNFLHYIIYSPVPNFNSGSGWSMDDFNIVKSRKNEVSLTTFTMKNEDYFVK